MTLPRPSTAVAAGAAAASLVLADAAPALAYTHTVSALANGGHVLIAKAAEHEGTGAYAGLEYWRNHRTSETTPTWDTVCNYQSYLAEIAPDGRTYRFTQYSSHHRNCSYVIGYFDWPNWTAWYLEDTRFRAKWRSDNTVDGDWQVIGDVRD